MNRFHFSWLFGLVLATTPGCDRTVGVGSMDEQTCAEGDTKLADDGCNHCSCGTDGTWACTEMACLGTGGTTGAGGTTSVGGATGVGGAIDMGVGGMITCCLALPVCGPGEVQVSGPEACAAGGECYENTACCTTIWCMKPTAQCTALPTCDAGDTQIDGTCPPDGSCYERTMCGTTINCRKATPSCTPGATKAAEDGCNSCTCTADGIWACTLMACVDCIPGQWKVCDDGCNTSWCAANGTWTGCTERGCTGDPCDNGMAQYTVYRNNLMQKYGHQVCTSNSDCRLMNEHNLCASSCGRSLSTSWWDAIDIELTTAANTYCGSCTMPAAPDCHPELHSAVCLNGTCDIAP